MKTKLAMSSFVVAFAFSIAIVTFYYHNSFSYCLNNNEQESKKEILKFLQSDHQILLEMMNEMDTVPQMSRIQVMKKFYEKREGQDVSKLPDNFQNVWERKILSEVEWVNFMIHLRKVNGAGVLKTNNQQEIAERKIKESQKIEKEFESVCRNYGIDWDVNGVTER